MLFKYARFDAEWSILSVLRASVFTFDYVNARYCQYEGHVAAGWN